MGETRTRTGRPALSCDGRQHADGEHECRRRFWSPMRDADSYPAGVAAGDLRVRARRQGWSTVRATDGRLLDLCPYHGPDDVRPRRMNGSLLEGMPLGSSATVKPNETGGLDAFVIRRYPGDDPPEGG